MPLFRARKELLSGFLFFVEAGETVDTQVISATIKPDNSPTTNWTDRPDQTKIEIEHTYIVEEDMVPSAQGGFVSQETRYRTGSKISFTDRNISEQWERMSYGLKTKIAATTAQLPFAAQDNAIFGWLKIQQLNQEGTTRIICDVWGKLILSGNSTVADVNTTKPQFVFQVRESALNAWVAPV